LSSLTLWYNEGVPVDEIAKRLKKTTTSIANVISNKKGTLRNAYNPFQESKSNNELVFHNVSYLDNLIVVMSIIKINNNFFKANAWVSDINLSKPSGIMNSEFTTLDACHRWFESLPELYSINN
jgi:hypothetical protein